MNRTKGKIICAAVGFVVVLIIMTVCIVIVNNSTKELFDDIDARYSDAPAAPTQAQGGAATKITKGGKSPEREAVEDEIKAALADHFAAEDITITVSDETQTVSAVSPDLTTAMTAALEAQTAPEGWGDMVATMTELAAALPLLPDIERSVLYVKSAQDGDIYLTVTGGKVTYNVIEPPDEGHGNGPGYMTLDIYNQITTGMTYGEVVNLVGAPGDLLSEVSTDGVERTAMYSWDGQGMSGANANITIQGERVISKAQFGLE